ncbi:hypothetical protein LCGC14_0645790 [marine sediment metagenome]|uniref:Uncharacterized protein n=1 Tax=marine sediment metagenome TaxID=412755 RepID=A0A0F9TJC7_9ZZZZ
MSGDLLKTFKTALQKQMVEGMGAHVAFRGLTIPIDPFLEGSVRTGRKIEFTLPLIAPDNKFALTEDAVFDTDRIEIDRTPDWVLSGGYMTIGQRELHLVEDVSDTTVIFASRLLADHPVNTPVYHHSNPIVVEGAYAAGQTTINVDVPYFLVRGDMIGVSPSLELDISFVEYRVTDLRFVGIGSNGLQQYQVVLHRALHRALTDGEVIQLRAYPAYVSPILPIPQPDAADLPVVGPFLVDWLSAPFLNDMNVEEHMTLQQYNDARLPIGSPFEIQKNHQILYTPIRADQFLWWDLIHGRMKYDGAANRLVAIPDDEGYWNIQYTCVPVMDVPFTTAKGLIVTVPVAQLLNNDSFRLVDDVEGVTFEYQVDGTYVKTTEVQAEGILTVTGIPTDNETFVLDDGFDTVITFEFKRTAGFTVTTSTNRIVDITTASLNTDVAIEMEQAINAIAALQITSDNVGAVLTMTNDNISLNGNTTIVESSAGLTITQQFIGGTDRVITIDVSAVTTALETAQQTAAGINRAELNLTAEYPTIANATRVLSTVDGTGGNNPITESVVDAGFVVQGMSGGAGGTTWNMQVVPDQDILLRIRLYPNDYQDYTLLGGSTTTIAITLEPADEPVERIELLINGTTDTEIRIGDWGIRGAKVAALRHTYVAHVQGERNYACTGLMVKPLFHSKEDLRVNFDSGANFNSGGVRI